MTCLVVCAIASIAILSMRDTFNDYLTDQNKRQIEKVKRDSVMAADYLSRAGRKVGEIFSKDESRGFVERKEVAMNRLFESKGEHRLGWTITAWSIAVISSALFLLTVLSTLVTWALLFFFLTHVYFIIDWTGAVQIIGLIFLAPWVSILLLFYGVLPAIRSRPKIIELLEDRITIHFKNRKVFNLYFTEIESIRFFDHVQKSKRVLKYRILDPFHRIDDYSKFNIIVWLNEVVLGIMPPFSFGFGSKKGEVLIRRKKGWNRIRLFIPWLNTSKRSRTLSLTLSDPKEYFQQLELAYTKWKRSASSENNRSQA